MRETNICKVADSNPTRSRVFVNLRLISIFLFHVIEIIFVVFPLVFATI